MEVNKKFDASEGCYIYLKIIVVDGGSPELTGTASVNVKIMDQNDDCDMALPENKPNMQRLILNKMLLLHCQ